MTSVQSDYSSNKRSIEDLEKDYEVQKKRLKKATEQNDEYRNKVSISNKKDLESAFAVSSDKLKSSLEEYKRSLDQNDKSVREDYAKQNYDSKGRLQSELKNKDTVTQTALESTEKNLSHLKDAQGKYEDALKLKSEKRDQATNENIQKIQNSYQNALQAQTESGNSAKQEYLSSIESQLKNEVSRAQERADSEISEANRRVAQTEKEAETQINYTKDKTSKESDKRAQNIEQTYEKKLVKNTEAERKSRALENKLLRSQNKEAANNERDISKVKAETRADVIRETESSYYDTINAVQNANDDEKMKLKNTIEEQDHQLTDKFYAALKEKELAATKIVQAQNRDHNKAENQLENQFEETIKEFKGSQTTDKNKIENLFIAQRDKLIEQNDKTLKNQSELNANLLHQDRKQHESEMKRASDQLKEIKTTQDPNLVSPGVENTIQARIEKRYNDAYEIAQKHHQEQTNRIADQLNDRTREVILDKQQGISKVMREVTLDKLQLQNTLENRIAESEFAKEEAIKQAENSKDKTVTMTQKNMERAQNAQRLQYEEMMNERDHSNRIRQTELKQDADFEMRKLRREFQTDMNLKIREYEKQLSTQKENYEATLSDLKSSNATSLRNTEKRMTELMNDQSRIYEKRLAEMESQAKQREKLQEKIYEDELDKVKRSNALLLAKKS